MHKEDLIGKRFGDLKVVDELEPHITPNGSKQRIVKCVCNCGNTLTMRLEATKKNKKCTNCLYREKRVDITGKKFGKLTVISMADDYISPSGHRLSQCNCLCDCGKTTTVLMSGLVTGSTKSCGCMLNSRGLLKDNKELMKRYDFEKNKDVDLETLTARCNKKVWLKCDKCGESWLAQVASQNDRNKKHGCPYCSGRFVVKGKNDLLSQRPDLVDEWDFEKNKITPDEVHVTSGRLFWWVCKTCGKKWKATPGNRSYRNSGCPHCNKENVNSFCEQALFYYIKRYFGDAINSDTHIGMELDIYIPSINVALEYDGEAWHRTSKKIAIDEKKNKLCIDNNITLIRIREPKLKPISDCVVFVREDSTTDKTLNYVIKKVLEYLKVVKSDVDVERDSGKILAQYASKKKSNSLAVCCPEIAKEFHPSKNGKLTPDMVSKSARRKVWWIGKCGHEWQATVNHRCNSSALCPICFRTNRSPSVVCIETGKNYINAKETALDVGIKYSSAIYACCRGDAKTAGGYHWKYFDKK